MISYEIVYKVLVSDIDCFGQVKPAAIMNMMQEAATIHADVLGIGYHAMLAKNEFWVITRMTAETAKCAALGDELSVTTFPHRPGNFEATRDFLIRNKSSGELCYRGSTNWCVIDGARRRPVKIDLSVFDGANVYLDKCVIDGGCKRLGGLPDEAKSEPSFVYRIGLSDLDRNFHTNNIKYMDMFFNCFGKDDLKGKTVSRFDINFISEAGIGDIISVYKMDSGSDYTFESVNKGGKIISRAKLSVC